MKRGNTLVLMAVILSLLFVSGTVLAQPQHFTYTQTLDNHSILIDYAAVNSMPLQPGDEVGVFTPTGVCAGAGVWNGENLGIAAWGDDGNGVGFLDGDALEFHIWDASTGFEWAAEILYAVGDPTWSSNGITRVGLNATDDGLENGDPYPMWDIVHFGTVFQTFEMPWKADVGLVNRGDGTLIVNDWDNGGMPLDVDTEFPIVLGPQDGTVFNLLYSGGAELNGQISFFTTNGTVQVNVIAHTIEGANSYFENIPATSLNHSILINGGTFNNVPLMPGDEIAVIGATSGLVAGWGKVNADGQIGFPVWGDDALTAEIDGLVDGELMEFHLFRRFEAVEAVLTTNVIQGSLNWSPGGVTVLEVNAIDEAAFGNVQVDNEPIMFPLTQVGHHRMIYKQGTNTSLTGWSWALDADGSPQGVFNVHEVEKPYALAPGATAYFGNSFEPQDNLEYAGQALYLQNDGSWIGWDAYGTGIDGIIYNPEPTSVNHSLIIHNVTLDGEQLQPGDEVGVLTPAGDVAGGAVYTGELPMGLPLWGSEDGSPGFFEGDLMAFRVWDSSEAVEYLAYVNVLVQGDTTWTANGITGIELAGVVPPWEISRINGQVVTENQDFIPYNLDDFITNRHTDPSTITWNFSHVTEGPNGFDLTLNFDEVNRILQVSVPDTEWVGTQTIQFSVEDRYGYTDFIDVTFEVLPINEAPLAFELLSPDPVEQDSVNNARPIVTWSSSSDIDWYDSIVYNLYFSVENHSGETTDYQVLGLTDTQYELQDDFGNNLGDDIYIHWRVEAVDSEGLSTWAGPEGEAGWTFLIYILQTPYDFHLLTPADGTRADPDGVVRLSWENNGDPDPGQRIEYILMVADNPGLSNPIYFRHIPDGDVEPDPVIYFDLTPENTPILSDEGYYWWRVRANDEVTGYTWAIERDWSFQYYIPDPPADFNLISPIPGNVEDIHGPTLTWEASSEPDYDDSFTYTLEWSFDVSFESSTLVEGLTTESYTFAEEELTEAVRNHYLRGQNGVDDLLPDDVNVYWRVHAVDGNTEGTWSNGGMTNYWMFSVYVQQQPNAFTLVSPENADTSFDGSQSFIWENNGDPDPGQTVSYMLYISYSEDMSEPFSYGPFAEGEFYNSSDETWITDDTPYWWTVKAIDAVTEEEVWATDTWMYRVYIPEAPLPYDLVSPENESILATMSPTLSWDSTTDPDPDNSITYNLHWSFYSDFSSETVVEGLVDNFYTFEAEEMEGLIHEYLRNNPSMDNLLPDDVNVFWKVLAVDQNSDGTWSNQEWMFSIYIPESPGDFYPLLPVMNHVSHSSDVQLVWQQTDDPDPDNDVTYDVYLRVGEGDYLMVAEGLVDTFYTYSAPEDDQSYYWTVFADDANTGGTWASDTLAFSTYLYESPGNFDLVSPARWSQVMGDGDTTLTWGTSVDPDPGEVVSYQVFWSTDPNFETDVNSFVTELTFYDVTGLVHNSVYYWKVEALDANTESTWSSETWELRVFEPSTSGGFALLTPENGSQINENIVDVSWATSADPNFNAEGDLVIEDPIRQIVRENSPIYSQYADLPKGSRLGDGQGVAATDDVGGPDTYGYIWRDSHEPGGPVHNYVDYSALATLSTVSSGDDETEEVELPFSFPFYGIDYSMVNISSNGNIHFGTADDEYTNSVIPDAAGPAAMIAPFWDDLNPSSFGNVYYYHNVEDNSFIVQYSNMARWGGTSDYNFQVILYPDGRILYQYGLMDGMLNSATIGIENPDETDGLLVAFNAEYLSSDMAILITPFEVFYTLQWATDENFVTMMQDITRETSYTLTDAQIMELLAQRNAGRNLDELPDDNTIFWRVSATNLFNYRTWATPISGFTFDVYIFEEPMAFNLLTPDNGEVVETLLPTLTWEEAVDPDPGDIVAYDLYWTVNDPDFLDPNMIQGIEGTSYTFEADELLAIGNGSSNNGPVNRNGKLSFAQKGEMAPSSPSTPGELDELPDDVVIYWYIHAVDMNTGGTLSVQNPMDETTWNFEVYVPEPPSDFSLLSPADAFVSNEFDVVLSWGESINPDPDDPMTYSVWVSTDPIDFENPGDPVASELTDLSWTFTGVDDMTYYWAVKAIDTNSEGTWSTETWSFSTYIFDEPLAFNLLTPTDGEVVATLLPTLTWEEAVDPDPGDVVTYNLVWTVNDPDFVDPDMITGIEGTSYTFEPDVLFGDGGIQNIATRSAGKNVSAGKADTAGPVNSSGGDELDELPDDVVIYWYIQAIDTNTEGTLSVQNYFDETLWNFEVYVPEAPEPFSLTSPADEFISNEFDVVLTWEEAINPDPDDPMTYSVWVDTDPINTEDPGDPDAVDLTDLTWTFTGEDDMTYYWTVKAVDSNTDGTWANEIWSFSTYIFDVPVAFNLLTPTDGELVETLAPTVTWEAATDPDPDDVITYNVVWSIGDETFADPDSVEGLTETTYTFEETVLLSANPGGKTKLNHVDKKVSKTSKNEVYIPTLEYGLDELDELPDDSIIYWYVRAVDTNTDGTVSVQNPFDATTWNFEIYFEEPPEPFSLVAPADASILDALTWTFEWEASSDPDPGDVVTYTLEISTDDAFTDPALYDAGENLTFEVTDLVDDTDYWWRVFANDPDDVGTYSTETWTFSTAMPELPSAFNLLDPVNDDTLQFETDFDYEFIWESSIDPDPTQNLVYDIYMHLTMEDEVSGIFVDTTMSYAGFTDTSFVINLPDSLSLITWEVYPEIQWWVEAISEEDTVECNERVTFWLEPNSPVEEDPYSLIPKEFAIDKAYPNPFNPSVNIILAIPENGNVRAEIFDILGRRVATITDNHFEAGYHRVYWQANGPTGVYFLRVTSPDKGWSAVHKLVYMK